MKKEIMKFKFSLSLLSSFFLLVLLLSAILQNKGFGSTAYGILYSSITIIVLYVLSAYQSKTSLSDFYKSTIISFFIIIFTLCHGLLVSFFMSADLSLFRLLVSSGITLFLISAAFIFSSLLRSIDSKKFKLIISSMILLMILLIPVIILRYSPISPLYLDGTDDVLSSIVIFSEPSHFIIAFLPFFLYSFIMSSNKKRLLIFSLGLVGSFLLGSSTLALSLLGIILLILVSRPKILLLCSILLIFIIFLLWLVVYSNYSLINPTSNVYVLDEFLTPIYNILNPSLESNLSTLTYMVDWHEAYLNFIATNGMGIGFQQTGLVGERSYLKDFIFILSGSREWNIKFESFSVLPKLISEFGIFAIIFLFFYAKIFFDSASQIIKNLSSNFPYIDPKALLINCFIVCFAVNLLIRGIGYFTTSTFFFIVACFYLSPFWKRYT